MNNTSTANLGSLSPDHIWDKYSSSDKKNYEQVSERLFSVVLVAFKIMLNKSL